MENAVASKSRKDRINSSVPCPQTKQGWSCNELPTFCENDDTSSRRAPESDTNESVLEERIAARRTEIEQYANISELSSHLVEEGLLNHEEKEYLESGALSDADKISRVLDSLKEKENGFSKFLACQA